jgi:hypothetical protein
MAIYYRHKLINWNNRVYLDLRSYEVEQALKTKKPIRVVVGDKYMDLDIKTLRKPYKKSELFRSKVYQDQTYRLYSYQWKNTKPVKLTPEQEREEFKKSGVYI